MKEGMLATIARAAGERGTLTDQDAARARALFPVTVPAAGALPDTQEVGTKKLAQLRRLLDFYISLDPLLAKELESSSAGQNSTSGGFTIDSMTPVAP